ncbi:ABC transporter substrate-binding protein [Polymorphum gilvum]|uniref:Peptide/opine/nickel uptake family ABC transporter, periplasmic substrate-binding protein n=1 Tax=Polymorphum gilvum (strain LMG 25793 / CGMCC 1.9160 / SL003B-26A1) TaxID=991905 RepID=F2J6D1_POLGS|nr:ABC transporter substrate-binding protein [Polymorphum gilvum]ADZ71305.1 Peptide/opine/nickel uptake family ABC transporter, periplasmic substrate-binding protein [Polymorphum gilvum SL003B-26A1]
MHRIASGTARGALMAAATVLALWSAPPAAEAARTDVVLGVRLEPPHLDPTAGAAAAIDEVVFINVFEGLTQVDRDGSVKPALAESWTISEDGRTYVFQLREGVTFHDGTDFTAEDVVFSFDRARADDSVNAQKGKFEVIDTVTADSPTQVTVTLKRPVGDFLITLGTGDAVIVAPESAETNKSEPVGTGPFRFSRWVQGDRIELVRNPDFWGPAARLDKATFKIIGDNAAAFAALMAGDVDGFPIYPAPENLPQFETDPRFAVVVGSTEGETILATNNARPPFDDLKVRQAIAHAIDRQAIIDGAMFGYGTPIGSHFAPHHPAHVDLTGTYPHDIDKAKALLAEAGHPDGFKATLKLPPPSYARRGGEILASDLKKIGIELELIPLEWAQWLEQVFKGKDYDLTIVSHTEANDIDIYARDDYYFNYASPDLKAVMERLNATTDTEGRYALMREAQEIVSRDAVNGYLFQLAKTGVWDARLKGLWENAPVQANDLTGVYWDE